MAMAPQEEALWHFGKMTTPLIPVKSHWEESKSFVKKVIGRREIFEAY